MISKLAARACPALLLLGCGGVHAAWLETRIAIEDFAVEQDYEAAFELSDELVAQAEAEFGAASTELVDAHLLLASLYRQHSNFDDAELHLLRAIEVIERRDGEQSVTLIQPLVTLGDTYFDAGSYPEALATYEDARSLGRRAQGLLNVDQIDILARMSAAALLMDDYRQARNLQYESVAIVQRTHGEDSIEYLDAQLRLASWFTRRGQAEDAGDAFDEVDKLFWLGFADDPIVEIRILRSRAALARIVAMSADPDDREERPVDLTRALDISRELEVPNPLLEAEILRDIGDWNVALSRVQAVLMPYEEAWAILDSIDGGFRLQQEWFSGLTLITEPRILSRIISSDVDSPWGRIEVAFALDTTGRTSDIRVTQSDPTGLFDDTAIRQIELSRFRPRMDDRGRLIVSEATVGWDFQYDAELAPEVSANDPDAE